MKSHGQDDCNTLLGPRSFEHSDNEQRDFNVLIRSFGMYQSRNKRFDRLTHNCSNDITLNGQVCSYCLASIPMIPGSLAA